MEENKTKILETILTTLKELLEISKSCNRNFTSFENKYFNLKKQLALYIEKEDNESLKKCYLFEYRNILAFEAKAKGINTVRSNYEKSIKPKASVKSKAVFESSLIVAAAHIANDFDAFFHYIPENSSIINDKV